MTDRILTASHRGDIELVANFGQTGFYIKKFLLDDTANKNNWQAMWPAIKKYAASFVGQPVVLTPQMDHPDPKIQHIHAVGKIIDVGLDEEKKAAWQISRIDNPYVQQAIIDRDITYGSVSLSAPEDEIRDVGGVAVVSGRFLGRHDAPGGVPGLRGEGRHIGGLQRGGGAVHQEAPVRGNQRHRNGPGHDTKIPQEAVRHGAAGGPAACQGLPAEPRRGAGRPGPLLADE